MFTSVEDFKLEYQKKCLESVSKPMSDCTCQEKYEVLVKLIVSSISKVRAETAARQEQNHEKTGLLFLHGVSHRTAAGKLPD